MSEKQNPHTDARLQEKLAAMEARQQYLQDKTAAMLNIMEDLEEARQKAEENETKFRTLFENAIDGILVADCRTQRFVLANQQICKMIGYSPEELYGMSVFDLFPTDRAPQALEDFQRVIHGELKSISDYLIRRKDGTVFYADISAGLISIEEKQCIVGIFRDTTQRREDRQRLQQQQAELASIFRAAPAGIGVVVNRILTQANQRLCDMVGYTKDELIGQSARMLYPTQEEYEYVGREKYMQIDEKGTGTVETRWRKKDGTIMDILLSSTPFDPLDWGKGVTFTALDITVRKRAKRELARSNSFLRTVIDQTPFGIQVVEGMADQWQMTMVNQAAQQITGVPEQQQQKLCLRNGQLCNSENMTWKMFYPDQTPWPLEKVPLLAAALEGKTTKGEEMILRRADGTEFTILCNASPIRDDREVIIGGIVIFTDISERKKIENELASQQRQLSSIFDSVPVGISHVKDRVFVRVNQIYCQLFGYEEDELIGRNTSLLYETKEEFQRWGEALYFQLREKGEVTQEVLFRHKDGHMIDILLRAVYFDPSDPTKGELFALTDITERKQAQRALEFTQFAVEHISESAFWMDKDAKFFYVNEAACKNLGYTREELLTMSVPDVDPDFPARRWPGNWRELKETGGRIFESRHRTKDGKIFPVEISDNFVRFGGKEYNCAFARDISERKQAEQALAESEQRFRQMFERMSSAVIIYQAVDEGRDFVITDLNPSVERIEQCSKKNILNRRITEAFPGVEDFGLLDVFRRVYRTGLPAYHPVSQYKDQRITGWRENYVYKLSSGEIVALYDDVTEKKQAEQAREKLLKELRSKNEELESIVFIASHDLRSPLVNIEGFTGELKKACAEVHKLLQQVQCSKEAQKQFAYLLEKDIPESIGFISAGTGKMDTLLSGLLRLSRIGTATIHIEPINMKMLLQTVLGAMRFQIRELEVEVSVGDLPNCMGDAVQVNQVFSNLIDNAIKYRHPDRPARLQITGTIKGNTAVYAVADNGIGIDPQHHEKIFEIFHQLNPGSSKRGEGLGLTIIRRILNRLDGQIRVESEEGVGSTFYVSLPKAR